MRHFYAFLQPLFANIVRILFVAFSASLLQQARSQLSVRLMEFLSFANAFCIVACFAAFNMVLVYWDWCQRPYFGASTPFCSSQGVWIASPWVTGPWIFILVAETWLNFFIAYGGIIWVFNAFLPGLACFVEYIYLLKM